MTVGTLLRAVLQPQNSAALTVTSALCHRSTSSNISIIPTVPNLRDWTMTVLVLGYTLPILVASVSFLCYRLPPSTWLLPAWLRPPFTTPIHERNAQATPRPPTEPMADADKEPDSGNADVQIASSKGLLKKQDVDRAAMPPPPIVRKPSSPTTPRANPTANTSTIPSFALSDSMPPPPFPATNSAQRASGPPASFTISNDIALPSFPAANSAQRASTGTRGPPRLNPTPTSLMPPTARLSPLPNRGVSSSLSAPSTHNAPTPKPRKKIELEPGHSPLDWARLSSSPNANLSGLPPGTSYIKVPPSMLKQFNGRKGKDAWTVLGGKVYNITPYAKYHPGGVGELMRCAGKNGTKLFGEVHPWVNWEGMLSSCLVGVAVEELDLKPKSIVGAGMEDMD